MEVATRSLQKQYKSPVWLKVLGTFEDKKRVEDGLWKDAIVAVQQDDSNEHNSK